MTYAEATEAARNLPAAINPFTGFIVFTGQDRPEREGVNWLMTEEQHWVENAGDRAQENADG